MRRDLGCLAAFPSSLDVESRGDLKPQGSNKPRTPPNPQCDFGGQVQPVALAPTAACPLPSGQRLNQHASKMVAKRIHTKIKSRYCGTFTPFPFFSFPLFFVPFPFRFPSPPAHPVSTRTAFANSSLRVLFFFLSFPFLLVGFILWIIFPERPLCLAERPHHSTRTHAFKVASSVNLLAHSVPILITRALSARS
ncbi:hypothetical protein B0H66DRAFT_177092 [Apodospora peruviana]|uniref:Uncharacterized protein n=1 Tax=Apodospora peruviana TaxID=516989 RepID=A0AAE0IAV4_9PEZI|nr:hypothetical protein B0H66DRAFT_177092 [Apodospora peruviana]